ncbi:type II secretion system protein GspL [Zooshikella sp. RANM57]|uniref:type II secretion system protein GspL n=1 Tax=Zooshikella sp. RANM57 TaxID=3425863 RepID=UPI003D6EFED7
MSRLFIRFSSQTQPFNELIEQPISYAIYDRHDKQLQSSQCRLTEINENINLTVIKETIVFFPLVHTVVWFSEPPSKNIKHNIQAAPFLIEEKLCGTLEQYAFAIHYAENKSYLCICAIEKNTLEQLLSLLTTLPNCTVLPEVPFTCLLGWQLIQLNNSYILNCSKGFTCLPNDKQLLSLFGELENTVPVILDDHEYFQQLVEMYFRHRSTLIKPFSGESTVAPSLIRQFRASLVATLIVLIAITGFNYWQAHQIGQKTAALQDKITQFTQKLFPGLELTEPKLQLERLLNRRSPKKQPLFVLLKHIQQTITQLPKTSVSLQSINFHEDRGINVVLQASTINTIDQFIENASKQQNISIELKSANQQNEGVKAIVFMSMLL